MATKKVTLDNLDKAIQKILDEYQEDIYQVADEVGKKIAEKGRTALKNESMQTFKSRDGRKKYATGWSVASEKGRLWTAYEIHNRKQPTLTHLLEYGHVLWYFGRYTGTRTQAHPHINPMREKLAKEFEEEIVSDVSKL